MKLLIKLIWFSESANVVPSDLYEALDVQYESQHGAGMDSFATILGSWANEKGYPLVTISLDRQRDLLNINQKQFWSDPKRTSEDGAWWVPLNIATMDNPNFHQTSADDRISLRAEASKSLAIDDIEDFNPDNWFIVNLQQTGYYRVNYDTENWIRIIEQLRSDASHIHVLNRAALIDDVFVLAKTGDVNYELALAMSEYLRNEEDYIPWASALSHFDDLDRMLHSNEINENLMKFIADIIHDAYMSLGMVERNGEEMMAKYARTLIVNWACRVGDEDCLRQTYALFISMLNDNIKVDVNVQSAVYCAALRRSSETEFLAFMEKLAASDDQDERGRMIDALGCATDENKLKAFLVSSLDEHDFGYRAAEKPRVVLSVLRGSRDGVSAVISFYQENYLAFLEE